MRVLLTTLNSKYIHCSLSIKYLHQQLKKYCDSTMREYTINENPEDILADIIRGKYEVIGFSCYIWNIRMVLEICENLKKVNPNQIIFLGGPEVSYDPQYVLSQHPFIDYIVAGEGEESTPKLIRYLSEDNQAGTNLQEISGLSFWDDKLGEKRRIITTGSPSIVCDLSVVGSPYEDITAEEICNKIIYYETSRGCVYNCSYCLSATTKGVRYFPLEQVKKDILKLIGMNARQIKFVDRTFNADQKRTLEMIRFFKEADNGTINFHFEVTAHLLGAEILQELQTARSGLFQLEIGVQSTNPFTLQGINRVDQFDRLSENVRTIHSFHNIHQHLDLIAGLPYEDLSSFRQSFHTVYDLSPAMLQLGFLKLLKGSPIRDEIDKHGYIFRSYPPYEVLANKYISAEELLYLKEIEQLVDTFYNSNRYYYSMDYLSSFYRDDYFRFFEDLLKIRESHHGRDKISRDDSFHLLFIFGETLSTSQKMDKELLRDLLRFDYLRMGRSRMLPIFLKEETRKISRQEVLDFLDQPMIRAQLEMEDTHPLEILKKTGVERFRYDLVEYVATGNKRKKDSLIAFDYSGRKDIHDKVPFAGERSDTDE